MEKRVGNSIVEHFSFLTDPRILLKTEHKLIDIVVITVCAVLAGADDWVEIAGFGRAKEDWFRTFLELPKGIPSHDTFGRVFARIEPDEFGNCLTSWIREVFPSTCTDVIAIDGKTSRRSHDRAIARNVPSSDALKPSQLLSLFCFESFIDQEVQLSGT